MLSYGSEVLILLALSICLTKISTTETLHTPFLPIHLPAACLLVFILINNYKKNLPTGFCNLVSYFALANLCTVKCSIK